MGFREFSLLCCSVLFSTFHPEFKDYLLGNKDYLLGNRQERGNSHNIGFEVYGMETKRKTTIQALGYREWKEMETTIGLRALGVWEWKN